MKLNSAEFLINLIKLNFNELILSEHSIKLKAGEIPILKFNAVDAFDFVIFTGALYLCRKYGLILRDSVQFYTGINEYEIEPKLFKAGPKKSMILNKNSKFIDFLQYKKVLLNPKKILFYEYEGLSNFEHLIYDELLENEEDPSEFILFKIYKNNPRDLEGFFEFLSCLYFNKLGFFTRNIVPFGYGGRPDFLAVDHELFHTIIDNDLVNGPCSLFNLTILNSFKKKIGRVFTCPKPSGNYELFIGEAKVDPNYKTNTQIDSYLSKKQEQVYIHNIFEINLLKKSNPKYGLLNLSNDYKIKFENKPHNFNYKNKETLIDQNRKWFENDIKGLLLYNLPWEYIEDGLSKYKDYQSYIESYNIDNLCKEIKALR